MQFTTGTPEFDRTILAAVLSLLTALILRRLQPRSKVRWYSPHSFVFLVKGQDNSSMLVRTSTIHVENIGRERAENVEVHHAFRPANFQTWPTIDYEEATNPEGIHIIRVKKLAPKEHFTLELLAAGDLPMLSRIKSDAGEATAVEMRPQLVLPKWFLVFLWALLLIGAGTAFYWALWILSIATGSPAG